MTTVVHLGSGRGGIDPVAVAAACDGPVVFSAAADDPEVPEGLPVLRVSSSRSAAFRTAVASLLAVAAASLVGDPDLVVEGIDLPLVVRYEWPRIIEDMAHRVFVLRTLLEEACPDSILWLGSDAPADLAGVLAPWGVRGRVVGPSNAGGGRPASPRGRFGGFGAAVRGTRGADAGLGRGGVVAAETYSTSAEVLLPALGLLRASGIETSVLVPSPSLARAIDGAVPVHPLAETVSRRAAVRAELAARAAVRVGDRLAAAVPSSSDAEFAKLAPALEPGFVAGTRGVFADAARQVSLWTAAIESRRPRQVVSTGYSTPFARAAVLAARRAGVGSTYVQHALLFRQHDAASLLHDRYLVWGPHDVSALADAGVAPSAITRTGCASVTSALARSRGPQRPGITTVAYLPSRSDGSFVSESVARQMCVAVESAMAPDMELLIKVHPSDRSTVFDDARARVVRDADALQVMADADVVVAATSTAGFQACALDRPLVVLAFDGVEGVEIYEEYGAALLCRRPEDVAGALGRICLAGPETDRLAAGRRALVADRFGDLEPGVDIRIAAALAAAMEEAEIS